MKKAVRNSNYELIRIISMFMIIIWHIFLYGVDMNSAPEDIQMIFDMFRSILVVHVNSFILITGYFQCKTKFKMEKFLSINNAVLFYKIAILTLFLILNIGDINKITILRNIFPFDLENYWFIRIYLILYILSPFINILINKMTQNEHKKLLIILFIMFSVISTLTNQEAVYNATNHGYSIVSAIFLYLIGAYIRNYPIEKTYFGKKYTKSMQQLIFVGLFFFLATFNFSLHILSERLLNGGSIMRYIGNIMYIAFNQYDNPIVLLGSISYIMIFYYMSINSKIINIISSTTIGIYLIHENIFLRKNMYQIFHFPKVIHSSSIFIQILVVAFIIFTGCSLIEMVRRKVFDYIYNLKISKKNRLKYRNYIQNLGIHINWE